MPSMVLQGQLFGDSLGAVCLSEADEQPKDCGRALLWPAGWPGMQATGDPPENTIQGRNNQ